MKNAEPAKTLDNIFSQKYEDLIPHKGCVIEGAKVYCTHEFWALFRQCTPRTSA